MDPYYTRVTTASGHGLHLRRGPGTSYEVLATMPDDDFVAVVGSAQQGPGGSWVPVVWRGRSGWALESYLAPERGEERLVHVGLYVGGTWEQRVVRARDLEGLAKQAGSLWLREGSGWRAYEPVPLAVRLEPGGPDMTNVEDRRSVAPSGTQSSTSSWSAMDILRGIQERLR